MVIEKMEIVLVLMMMMMMIGETSHKESRERSCQVSNYPLNTTMSNIDLKSSLLVPTEAKKSN